MSWTTFTPTNAPSAISGTAYLDGYIYSLHLDPTTSVLKRWALGAAAWETLSAPASAIALPAAQLVAANDRIYAFAANYTANTADLLAYDPATATWDATPTPHPSPVAGDAAIVELDGLIYHIGGYTGAGATPVTTVRTYNPATDTWGTVASLPGALAEVRACAAGGYIYASGGWTGAAYQQRVYRYDPVGNSWSTLANPPSDHTSDLSPVVALADGRIAIVGAYDISLNDWIDTCYVYDPNANVWADAGDDYPDATPGHGTTAGHTVGSVVYVVDSSPAIHAWFAPAPSDVVAEVPFLEGNDRNQIIACVHDGTGGAVPQFLYWNPAPAVWSEALAGDPADYPAFFARSEAGSVLTASLELTPFYAGEGYSARITEVLVDFVVRPDAMDDYDGGVGSATVGFSGYVEGWGTAQVDAAGLDTLDTQVVSSAEFSHTLTPADLSGDPWPHRRTVRLPIRLAQEVRGARVGLLTMQWVEVLAVELVGTLTPIRGR